MGLAGVAVLVLLAGGSGAAAKASAPPSAANAAYSSLAGTEPSGLPVVDVGSPTALALGRKGPVFPVNPSAGTLSRGPLADSIRKLTVSAPDVSAWISESAEGGICVLASRHQPVMDGAYGLGMSCVPEELLSSGTMLELQNPNSARNIVVGVLPDGVSAVDVTLSNGDSQTVPVTGNAWSLETGAQVESTHIVTGG